MSRACHEGGELHILDPRTLACLECGSHQKAAERHSTLLANEPAPGSIVLTDGWTGRAWQRLYSNSDVWGSILSTKTKSWTQIMATNRPGPGAVRLIYIAPLRD